MSSRTLMHPLKYPPKILNKIERKAFWIAEWAEILAIQFRHAITDRAMIRTKTWISGGGNICPIKEMTDRHLKNILKCDFPHRPKIISELLQEANRRNLKL